MNYEFSIMNLLVRGVKKHPLPLINQQFINRSYLLRPPPPPLERPPPPLEPPMLPPPPLERDTDPDDIPELLLPDEREMPLDEEELLLEERLLLLLTDERDDDELLTAERLVPELLLGDDALVRVRSVRETFALLEEFVPLFVVTVAVRLPVVERELRFVPLAADREVVPSFVAFDLVIEPSRNVVDLVFSPSLNEVLRLTSLLSTPLRTVELRLLTEDRPGEASGRVPDERVVVAYRDPEARVTLFVARPYWLRLYGRL